MKTNKKRIMLPSKMSALLEMALKDLLKAEDNPKLKIDMKVWHTPLNDGKKSYCAVCLVGSVLVSKKMIHRGKVYYSDSGLISKGNEAKLDAINALRTGEIQEAYDYMHKEKPCTLPYNIQVSGYHENRENFFSDMWKLLGLLRSVQD